jgi:hypothetical protein
MPRKLGTISISLEFVLPPVRGNASKKEKNKAPSV